jgi:hypothetical protein
VTPSDRQASLQAVILSKERINTLKGKYYLESEQPLIKLDSSLAESRVDVT